MIGCKCDTCPAIDICLCEGYGIYNCLKAFEDWLNEDTPKTKCEKWKESLSRFKKDKEEQK